MTKLLIFLGILIATNVFNSTILYLWNTKKMVKFTNEKAKLLEHINNRDNEITNLKLRLQELITRNYT